jgi:hypothetical protein
MYLQKFFWFLDNGGYHCLPYIYTPRSPKGEGGILYYLCPYYCEHSSLRYTPLPTSVQHISINKTLLIVPTKNERDPPLFTGKLLIKFQNILRNTTQVIRKIGFLPYVV